MKPGAHILSLNSGSSSLKFALFAAEGAGERRVARGAVEKIGEPGARAWLAREAGGVRHASNMACADAAAAVAIAFGLLDGARLPAPDAIGHRIVHGGPTRTAPCRIDDAVLADLRAAIPLAPLHQPAALRVVLAAQERAPGSAQVACFDTAFFAALPVLARRLPLADAWDQEGLRRYGFHGLSYEFVARTLAGRKAVVAHLGSGSSLAAIDDGAPIDVTMATTPNSGVMMGTRTGDLDPGVVLYLMREKGLSAAAIERVVEREAGLRGVGGTSDMQTLLATRATDPRARLAVAMYTYGVKKAIGAFAAALGGLDELVFTGGIGENAPDVRAEATAGLAPFGVCVDAEANGRARGTAAAVVSPPGARVTVRVVPTDEDAVVAAHVRATLGAGR
jgi:acetate kinase